VSVSVSVITQNVINHIWSNFLDGQTGPRISWSDLGAAVVIWITIQICKILIQQSKKDRVHRMEWSGCHMLRISHKPSHISKTANSY